MKIYIASDHAGFELKRELISYLIQNNFDIVDCGPDKFDHEDDYPDYVSIVGEHISNDSDSKGVIIGYSGQGEAIVVNRFSNVRCAVYYGGPKHILTLSREHNDANVLSLGSHFLTNQEAKDAVIMWLNTEFPGEERHIRRIKKIERYD